MKRILMVLSVAVMMLAMTIPPAFASHTGFCYYYNVSAGNFLVYKETPSGETRTYTTNRPPKHCYDFGWIY
jgi:hypothetical protein